LAGSRAAKRGVVVPPTAADTSAPYCAIKPFAAKRSTATGFHAGHDGWIHDDALGILKVDEVIFWDKSPREKGKFKFAQPANRTCPGDSGGPTLGLNNGRWYVVGVTSRVMPDMRHRFSWIIPLIRKKELPDYARYCGEYYTSERVTENLEFLVKGIQTLVSRHPQLESSPPSKASSKRRK
jgi:hypothetical protein